MRILHVDDHALFCEGLALLFATVEPESQLESVHTLAAAVTRLRSSPRVDLILTDLRVPDAQGTDAVTRLREADERAPIVVVSAVEDVLLIRSCIDKGAMGYITKSATSRELSEALERVLMGNVYLPSVARAASKDVLARPLPLTPRQLDVLWGMVQGHSNKTIARHLLISDTTVKGHVADVLEALGVHSRTQAVYAVACMGVNLPELMRHTGAKATGAEDSMR